jgi:spore coat polysaccharide biosynthesis protein SpsF
MIAAIIQARMGSTRLPGKVLKNMNGSSLLEFQIERVKKSKNIKNIIVATSTNKNDDEIEKFCLQKEINFYRGSEDDVLSRYYDCAKIYNIQTIVRLTADCPLIDPVIIDKVIDLFIENDVDYSSNTVPPETSFWPDGSDVEVFSFEAIEKAYKKANKQEDKEHVTFLFWKDKSNGFKINQLSNIEDWSDYRYTVDYDDDFKAIKMIHKEIKKRNIFGHVNEIIDILKSRSDIKEINNQYYFGIGWDK